MVRIQNYAGPAGPSKPKKQAAGKKKRAEMEIGESSAPLVESSPAAMLPAPPSTENHPATPTPLPIVPAGACQAVEGGEEIEEEVPLLKKRRLVRLANLPSGPSGQTKGDKKKEGKGKKDKEKVVKKWESTISLEEDASIAALDVSLHLAEKVITPVDEEFMESFSDMELAPRLVRGCMRGVTMAFEAYRRIERLDSINRSQSQEILDLTERVKTLRDELLEVKEERDLLRGQHSSLEGEKESWEGARRVLQTQLAAGEEERGRLVAENDRLVGVGEKLKEEMRVVQERSTKYLHDCQAAVEGQCRTEDMMRELRCSIKWERIEAIKRWKRRKLNAECLELASDVTLSVLKRCHEVHFPAGSDGPSFEDYAEPLLPALGLSLEGMKKMVEGERSDIPDEELDLSSEEEEGEDVPLSSPHPGSLADLTSADPISDLSSPRGGVK